MDRFPDTVHRCGDHEVMSTDDGRFGWFSAAEQGPKPTAGLSAG